MSRRWLWVAALVAVVALAAAGGALGLRLRAHDQAEQARTAALDAATSAATDVLSYDYRRIGTDIAAAEKVATGTFLEQYRQTTDDLVEQAKANEAVVDAQVVASSVQHADADSVVALLFVDQRTVRKGDSEPSVEQSRVRLTMVESGGRWLISELTTV